MSTVVVIEEEAPSASPPAIYVVVVLRRDPSRGVSRDRTWGWYSKFEDAESAVLSNATDMFEDNYYDVGLIEEVPEGIVPIADKRWWYKATYDGVSYDPKVEKTEPPEWSEGVVNYSMG